MWTPKQLLHGKIIDALFLGGFSKLQIEFLGWLSYNAAALNNSRNPVKAAHTILAKASDPDLRMSKMLDKFSSRKRESIQPVGVAKHPEADAVFNDLRSDIDDALVAATMRAANYEDFTTGGVSDGTPLTREVLEEEIEPVEEIEESEEAANA